MNRESSLAIGDHRVLRNSGQVLADRDPLHIGTLYRFPRSVDYAPMNGPELGGYLGGGIPLDRALLSKRSDGDALNSFIPIDPRLDSAPHATLAAMTSSAAATSSRFIKR
jgi:hypothetical protein